MSYCVEGNSSLNAIASSRDFEQQMYDVRDLANTMDKQLQARRRLNLCFGGLGALEGVKREMLLLRSHPSAGLAGNEVVGASRRKEFRLSSATSSSLACLSILLGGPMLSYKTFRPPRAPQARVVTKLFSLNTKNA